MLNRYVLAAFLILAGTLLLMTNLMVEPLTLTFWDSVMTVVGLGFILKALLDGPRWFRLGLGAIFPKRRSGHWKTQFIEIR